MSDMSDVVGIMPECVEPVCIPGEPLVWWPDKVIGVPSPFLRSALFTVSKSKRTFFRQTIFSTPNSTIIFSGLQLGQADLDVWAAVLKISRFKDDHLGVMFQSGILISNVREFLRGMGRGEGGQDIRRLVASLTRLQAAVIEVNSKKYNYLGNLIDEVTRNRFGYWISINPDLARLFGRSGWTGVEVDQRKKLQKFPLAQWLHGFYSSHRHQELYFYSIKKIRFLSGSVGG